MEKTLRKNLVSRGPQETKDFAKEIAKNLQPGAILALYGQLGSGKTTFVQGLASALGYQGRVTSPTFIFVRPYQLNYQKASRKQKEGIQTLYHIDLYRLEDTKGLKTIGIEEFLADKTGVSVIEWPDKIENLLPENTLKIKFEVTGEDERVLTRL